MRRMYPKRRRRMCPFSASYYPFLSGEGIQAPHTRDKRMSLVCGSLFLSGEGIQAPHTPLFPSPSPLRTIRVFLLFFYDFMALCPVDKDNFYNIIRELLCY